MDKPPDFHPMSRDKGLEMSWTGGRNGEETNIVHLDNVHPPPPGHWGGMGDFRSRISLECGSAEAEPIPYEGSLDVQDVPEAFLLFRGGFQRLSRGDVLPNVG